MTPPNSLAQLALAAVATVGALILPTLVLVLWLAPSYVRPLIYLHQIGPIARAHLRDGVPSWFFGAHPGEWGSLSPHASHFKPHDESPAANPASLLVLGPAAALYRPLRRGMRLHTWCTTPDHT